jgi:7-carboxy-7-deazaguanine synthase
MKIKINEIFTSIDGEVNRYGQGGLTTFIRFAGCNLRCSYCDTKQAQMIDAGIDMTIDEIAERIEVSKITITGGEPLCQENELIELIDSLCFTGVKVTIETNGSLKIPYNYIAHPDLVGWVIDYKFEYVDQMMFYNFYNAGKNDWMKFVIDSEKQYFNAVEIIKLLSQNGGFKGSIAFGFTDKIKPAWLVDRMIKDGLDFVTLNCQIHKFLDLK